MVVLDGGDSFANAGYVVMAAQRVTPLAINFMTRQARGWITLALTPSRCHKLGLVPMYSPRLLVPPTIEAREGISTGISVRDQAHSINVAIDPAKGRADIVIGGHVRPVMTVPGGVAQRPGIAEASVELARLAGLIPAGVLCAILNDDGSVARAGDLNAYCDRHGLRRLSIADIANYLVSRRPARTEEVTTCSIR